MKLLNVDTITEVKKKLDTYFSNFIPQCEIVSIRQAVGKYISREIMTDMDMPNFRRSVVDGYAVVAKDTFGVSDSVPVFLEVIGSVDMGKPCNQTITTGQAIYVPTGGMLPEGSDAMVMIEYVEKFDETTIAINKAATPNGGIMNRGDDFKSGAILFPIGHRITKKDIGMLAAVGCHEVEVYKTPVVSIISTGDEIIDIKETPEIGEIRDINSYTIAAFAEDIGATIGTVRVVKDTKEHLIQAVEGAMKDSDIVLLSGGSSAGNKDMTAEIIDSLGEPGVITHGIAMKPGKPTIIGVLKGDQKQLSEGDPTIPSTQNNSKLAVGLPGHPMAAIIAYHAIVDYFIRKYYFHNEEPPMTILAKISENIHAGEGRETFQLVRLEKDEKGHGKELERIWLAKPIHAKSGSISQLMYADGYVRMSSLSEGVHKDDIVEVTLISN